MSRSIKPVLIAPIWKICLLRRRCSHAFSENFSLPNEDKSTVRLMRLHRSASIQQLQYIYIIDTAPVQYIILHFSFICLKQRMIMMMMMYTKLMHVYMCVWHVPGMMSSQSDADKLAADSDSAAATANGDDGDVNVWTAAFGVLNYTVV